MKRNINLNPKYKSKIHLYGFGLGMKSELVTFYSDGRDYAATFEKKALLKTNTDIKQIKESTAIIKKASLVLKQIVEENNIENIVLKIDVEGAEYDIFDDLVKNYPELFDRTVKIVGETHLGFDKFYNKIKNFGYNITWKEPHNNGTCIFELTKKRN